LYGLWLQQEAALQEAVVQGQERERLLLDQHQQVAPLPHLTLLYLSLPFLTLPFLILPFLTLPYPTLSLPHLSTSTQLSVNCHVTALHCMTDNVHLPHGAVLKLWTQNCFHASVRFSSLC